MLVTVIHRQFIVHAKVSGMNDIGNGDTPAQEQGKVPHDRSSTNHMLAAAAIGLSLAFMIVVAGGYLHGWNWTGLPERTFWDWLKLLIVPAVLALGGYLFTRSENERTRELADRRAEV